MRRAMVFVAGVMVLGLVGSLTLASAERRVPRVGWGASSSTSDGKVSVARGDGDEKLVLLGRNEVETLIDNPPEGESQGDEMAVTGELFKGGKRVGRFDVHTVQTEANFEARRAALQVTFTATLPKGQITATGVAVFTPESQSGFEAGITGGTGRFDEAGGDVEIIFQQNAVKFVYDLEDLG
ncbi:MAG: hypothetical protein ABR529_06705 [Actinomycetota bacterium]